MEKIKNLDSKLNSKFYYDFNIGKLTWFRTGGNAKVLIIVEDDNELEIILNEIQNYKYYVIGAGSNILIRDNGFNGIVLKLGKNYNKIEIQNDELKVGANIFDNTLSIFTKKHGISGFEFFSGIPGTIGGAIKMNAGCYGSETKDLLSKVVLYNKKGQKKIHTKNNLELKYRSSNIMDSSIISLAYFKFSNKLLKDPVEIEKKINEIKEHRLVNQPIKEKTSGSTFKNPDKMYAAKLIEEAGCKGLFYGNASVSNKHANFLINNGKASANDIENLGKLIIEKVAKRFNVNLNWEIKIIGE